MDNITAKYAGMRNPYDPNEWCWSAPLRNVIVGILRAGSVGQFRPRLSVSSDRSWRPAGCSDIGEI